MSTHLSCSIYFRTPEGYEKVDERESGDSERESGDSERESGERESGDSCKMLCLFQNS